MALILTGSSGSTTLDSSAGLTFSDSSNQQYAAGPYVLKNRIINGAMVIDQRNAGASKSYPSATITYAVDRFFLYPSGAAVTGQQVAGTNTGTGYAFRITGATGNTSCNFSQRIENLNTLDLNNTTVTISFKAYASTSISNVTVAAFCGTSANSGYGGGNNVTSSAFSLSSGLNTISQTITLPSTASNGFEFAIGFGSGIGNTVTVDISNVQLEIGSTATPFERRLYNQELANCQRYYWKTKGNGTAFTGLGNGITVTTTRANSIAVRLPVTMRTNPSFNVILGGIYDGTNVVTISGTTLYAQSTTDSCSFDIATSGTSLNTYRAAIYGMTYSNGTEYFEASAEL